MAAKYDIIIEQGSTFALTLYYKDDVGDAIDLTGYTVDMDIRDSHGGTEIVAATISITDAPTGKIAIGISATLTAAITAEAGVYDIELTEIATDIVKRLMQGDVLISPEVTTPEA